MTLRRSRSAESYVTELERLTREDDDERHDVLALEAVQHHPENADVRFRFAMTRFPNDPDGGQLELVRAVSLRPDDPILLVRAAQAMFDSGQFDTAAEWVQRAAQYAPEGFPLEPELKALAARFVLASGEPDEAESMLRSAHAAAPHAYIPAKHLATFLKQQGRPSEALAVIQPLMGEHPSLRTLEQAIRESA